MFVPQVVVDIANDLPLRPLARSQIEICGLFFESAISVGVVSVGRVENIGADACDGTA